MSVSQLTRTHKALEESLLNAANVKCDLVSPDCVSLPTVQMANADAQVFTQV